ncbi:Phospholipase/carboxylesterase/thioesterase [Penicillium frequentans]|nr:Phospholipase/carboxylesterase/thioesterase [Penicillium glabrum]
MPRKPYPTPWVIQPAEKHTHTIIALHGRGSNAERFGHELLASANLQARLPTVRFVFPTASKRRSRILKRIPINQWFDNYSLDNPGQRTDLQVEGLSETAGFIRSLITAEARILDENYGKVILWGLSQGCAASIFTILGGWAENNEAKILGAFVGMSGWLPFEQQLHEILRCNENMSPASENHKEVTSEDDSDTEDDTVTESDEESEAPADSYSEPSIDDDPFKQISPSDYDFNPFQEDGQEAPVVIQAINHIRDILDLPMITTDELLLDYSQTATSLCHLRIPVFIGHGSDDPKVSARLGEKMSHVLSTGLGMSAKWKEYPGLGHWYRPEDEIEDILSFLQAQIDLPVEPRSPSSH